MTAIRVCAPCDGWANALDKVPDPVFSGLMMGDGIAIDPLDGVICAPCDGVVSALAPTLHSASLTLANGAELLIHIGIDTVGLAGSGFTARVAQGAIVTTGTPLIEVDLDYVMRAGKSLTTPMVVINDGFEIVDCVPERAVSRRDTLFEVRAIAKASPVGAVTGSDHAHCEVVIGLTDGIHARPAARIVAALKTFEAEVFAIANNRSVNARSVVALLGLGLRHGDTIAIKARGGDARAAVAAVVTLIESGMGEAGLPSAGTADPTIAVPSDGSTGALLTGVSAAPGLAIGAAFRLAVPKPDVSEDASDPDAEIVALKIALREVDARLGEHHVGVATDIVAAHRALLDDPELLATAVLNIEAGRSAARGWQIATRESAEVLRATGNVRLIERIADLTDIERSVVAALSGSTDVLPSAPPAGAILLADELLPSQFMAVANAGLAGICTAHGGPTSHVAILAAAAGIPMIVAMGPAVLSIADGRMLVLDADAATLDSAPDAEVITATQSRLHHAQAKRSAERDAAGNDCFTADGTRIKVFANLGSLADAHSAVAASAEGCGLLRTEFLFLDRSQAPSESEQRDAYAAIAAALGERPLIVRTLDIGGDKPVAYLPSVAEDNPALGARGIRMGLARPELLTTQLRAIVAGVPARQCHIMLPMIVDRDEFAAVRTMLDAACSAVGIEAHIPLGVMIETPAAALLAHSLAAEADFLSIGTNDLTQYTLAADRGNPAVAARVDALHPAVLRLIAATTAGATAHGRWVGVCGGLASDPRAAAILIGLGITELSATPAAVPGIKAAVRRLDMSACRVLAGQVLALGTAREVRALLGDA